MEQRYNIGQQYMTQGKAPRLCTVKDILKTYNFADELVSIRYVASHEFMGQIIVDIDVCDTTITRGLINKRDYLAQS